jgi:hypothetical protein
MPGFNALFSFFGEPIEGESIPRGSPLGCFGNHDLTDDHLFLEVDKPIWV